MTSNGEHVLVERCDWYTTITMNRPDRRNALSSEHMGQLISAFRDAGDSDARGVVLAANGPVFSAGHDFSEMAGADLVAMRGLLATCVELMELIQAIPQPVVARVHGLATAAGCQLVATCDLAVASDAAGFAIPGGKGGWFCHTPLVAVARSVGRKRAIEMAFTGDVVPAETALAWGLVNRVVPQEELDRETVGLLEHGDAWERALEGARQGGLLRPERARPSPGVRVRAGTHGRVEPDRGRAGRHGVVPGEAPTDLDRSIDG